MFYVIEKLYHDQFIEATPLLYKPINDTLFIAGVKSVEKNIRHNKV